MKLERKGNEVTTNTGDTKPILPGLDEAAAAITEAGKVYLVPLQKHVERFKKKGIHNCVAIEGELNTKQATEIKKIVSTVVLVPGEEEQIHTNATTAIKNGLVVKVIFPGKK